MGNISDLAFSPNVLNKVSISFFSKLDFFSIFMLLFL